MRNNIKQVASAAMLVLCSIAMLTMSAEAHSGELSPDWEDDIWTVYDTCVGIGTAAAVLGIAYGGLLFFGLNILSSSNAEKDMEKGKKIILYSVLGLLVLYLLPAAVRLGMSVIRSSGVEWIPPGH